MIRRAGPQDVPFLRDMLRHAFYWRLSDPASDDLPISRYLQGWGRHGDRAMIAIDDFQRVGAAWYRLFRSDRPGYGFLDEATPELAIAVVPSRRGRGFGHELLQALMNQARGDGFQALSLSVDRDNPSVKLYERYGFETVESEHGACTMRAGLTE
jgi:ribosomal protein S18 acetylase RimI-like enzyme